MKCIRRKVKEKEKEKNYKVINKELLISLIEYQKGSINENPKIFITEKSI